MTIDSGHWYKRDGAPFYTVRDAKGNERGVTLRDARKVGAVPSVTTVLQVVAKPQLETWKVRQGILAALTLPRSSDECDDAYLARVLSDSREQAKAAAEEGTRIHEAIEQSFAGKYVPDVYVPHVESVRVRIRELFPEVSDWASERSFAHASGFGGKVDLHSPSTGIVIDFKGKDGDFTDDKKLAYDQHYQLAAYQYGLSLPRNVCCNLFVSRTHPGAIAHHVWTADDVDSGLGIFLDALSLWKRMKHYDPSCPARAAA